jgi:CRISPR-associated protein Cmr4
MTDVTGSQEFLLYLYAESPVHAGAADSEGLLDLPIQREVSTTYPVIWGQSLKGALRQAAEDADWGRLAVEVFGPEVSDTGGSGLEAGRLVVGDAQLVVLPVATLRRTFAWVTTEVALARLSRKYRRLDIQVGAVPACGSDVAEAVGVPWAGSPREVLGPCVLSINPQPGVDLGRWANRIADDGIGSGPGLDPFAAKLRSDLLLVGQDVAAPLLKECTEVAVRVQLGKGKTVKAGPFHTEYLPTESVLAASLTLRASTTPGSDPAADRLRKLLDGTLLQIGGDETLGKGLVWCRLLPAAATPGPDPVTGPAQAGPSTADGRS